MSSENTDRLGLPYLMPAQAQKHVTVNESLRALDAIIHLSVIDRDLAAQPVSPANADSYILPASPTGDDWSGFNEHDVAVFTDNAWMAFTPVTGWRAHLVDEGIAVVFDGTGWVDESSLITSLNDLELLGLGTTADATNPFSAKLNKALWTALYDGEGGTGDLRYTLNKEAVADTVSLLFQTGFSGRAELGLIGDDRLLFKVSPDGSAWNDVMRADPASGEVSFPSGGVRNQLTAPRTYYVDASSGNDANDGLTSGTPFASIQYAIDTAASLDLGVYDITIDLANGTYPEEIVLKRFTGAGTITLLGDPTTPSNVVIDPDDTTKLAIYANGTNGYILDGMKIEPSASLIAGRKAIRADDCLLKFQNIEFGSGYGGTGGRLIWATVGATIWAIGDYEFTADADRGIEILQNSTYLQTSGVTGTLTGTPDFATAFLVTNSGSTAYISGSYSGAATGKRYEASELSLVRSGDGTATFFPGDVAGSTASGAVYV